MAARGSWTVANAVKKRWAARGLEAQFRALWGSQRDSSEVLALNDTEARPEPPMPYCVYEQGESVPRTNMTGKTSATEQQIQDVPIQFTVYGRTKVMAKDFLQLVAGAFDKADLELDDGDELVTIIRGRDFSVRQDDKTWSWTVFYTVRLIGTYQSALS
jgi:flagellar motor switch/type III secretory pathway protein FliN